MINDILVARNNSVTTRTERTGRVEQKLETRNQILQKTLGSHYKKLQRKEEYL